MDHRHGAKARARAPLRSPGRFGWLRLGLCCLGLYLGLGAPGPRPADAQPLPQAAPPLAAPSGLPQSGWLDPAQLERLVAPIALFDDELLLDTLDASLHPVQVLQARRFARQETGADPQTWAPSVRELLRLPRVLDMLADHPAWAEALARAYERQGPDLMDAVQRLRWRALDAGTLDPTDERLVAIADGVISIHAVGWMAVPEYDPWCVYGPWPAAPVQGFDYQAPAADCGFTPGQALVLVEPVPLLAGRWVWGSIDWRSRRVLVDREQWRRHAPGHPLPPGWSPRPPRPPAPPLPPGPPAVPSALPPAVPVIPAVPPPGTRPEPLRRGPGMRMPAPGQARTPGPPGAPPPQGPAGRLTVPDERRQPRPPIQAPRPVQQPGHVEPPYRGEPARPVQPRPAQAPGPVQPRRPMQGPGPVQAPRPAPGYVQQPRLMQGPGPVQAPRPAQGPGPRQAPRPAQAPRPGQPRPQEPQPQRSPPGAS
ncbi:MAG: DUF3300 domain-containing protein [Betaproteobacteria bacterium]|nr:DUF3300 domain-containing protein [Betaproteobacteria bacterium]MDE2151716.1 DUF3300 domain-containing protein [Betaproteobacteria bacterium]